VLEKISPTISRHSNFVRETPCGAETDVRFLFHHRDDPDRELTLTVLVFEVPAA
jgi:hypothetical protein